MAKDKDRRASPLPAEAAPVISIQEAQMTAIVFARGTNAAPMKAFVHVEKVTNRMTRKLTRAQWQAEYEKFLKEPR